MSDFENATASALGRIEQKIDTHIQNSTRSLDDHEDRLRSIEVTRNKFWGIVLGLTGLSGLVDWLAHHRGSR